MTTCHYHFSAGTSSKGTIGFCATIKAESKADAIRRLQELMPQELEVRIHGLTGDEYVSVYFNTDALNPRHIDDVIED